MTQFGPLNTGLLQQPQGTQFNPQNALQLPGGGSVPFIAYTPRTLDLSAVFQIDQNIYGSTLWLVKFTVAGETIEVAFNNTFQFMTIDQAVALNGFPFTQISYRNQVAQTGLLRLVTFLDPNLKSIVT